MQSRLLIAFIGVLSLCLLTAIRVNTPKQGFAYLLQGEDHIARGEDMKTDDHSYLSYGLGYGDQQKTLHLAERTTITLVDASTDVPRLALREGRVVTSGQMEITVRNTTIKTDGTMSFVFYSWLDKLEVINLTDGSAYSVNTLEENGPTTPFVFNWETSAAKDFYAWALTN